jgi:hypothetical protein
VIIDEFNQSRAEHLFAFAMVSYDALQAAKVAHIVDAKLIR